MNQEQRSTLTDEKMLFTLLTALVKKNNGEIKVTEQEMDSVTHSDMMMMYYDKKNKEIILTLHLLQGPASDEIL
jgi:hypothetical protein